MHSEDSGKMMQNEPRTFFVFKIFKYIKVKIIMITQDNNHTLDLRHRAVKQLTALNKGEGAG